MCSSLPMKDGLSEVAWSKLMERHTIENDSRVIEAYKVSKVHMCDYPFSRVPGSSYLWFLWYTCSYIVVSCHACM